MKDKTIKVVGARQHNLKGFDVEIPLNRITVITGVSGSGKSSLAFDTLYAEGQRRYVETFSPYARQFMDRMDRPHVDRIEGIPPAIAIEQGEPVKTSRSTVGTMTEITDYTKLLWARIAELSCRGCQRVVHEDTPQRIVAHLMTLPAGTEMVVTFRFMLPRKTPEKVYQRLAAEGLFRVYADGAVRPLEEVETDGREHIDVVVDRLVFRPDDRPRIVDSVEQALRFGQGTMAVFIPGHDPLRFSRSLHCPYCGISYRRPTPNLFSFNSPLGACDACRGFGRGIDIDLDLIIPDRNKNLRDGAIRPWTGIARMEFEDLMAYCHRKGIPTDVPFCELSDEQQTAVIEGDEDFYGVRGFFQWLESKKYKLHVRVFLARYRAYTTCPSCHGTRFKNEPLLWKVDGRTIADIYALTIGEAKNFFDSLLSRAGDEVTDLLLKEIRDRLRYLSDVGLAYLTLDRQSRTLSGGEVKRVSLTKALGSSLVNTLYILDEPSIGLHPRDSRRLTRILHTLRDLGNTVVVVEHDPEIITDCDYVVDLGPTAGERGGQLIYQGPAGGVVRASDSLTGRYLKGDLAIPVPQTRRPFRRDRVLTIRGAAQHNLKGITFDIPLGLMTCITGVSGSGKSTLADDILYRGLARHKGNFDERPGTYQDLTGSELVSEVVMVDQRPIGRTPRANPLTYVKAFDPIRQLFAREPLAKSRGYGPGTFSFNTPGGRCEECQGQGFEKVEMQFLSDVYLTCPVCKSSRFRDEILEVRYRGRSIHDVLQMTVSDALSFFSDHPRITNALGSLDAVGLGYLRLGQPLNTLSGGEAQRLKLAHHMRQGKHHTLFIFDEPTTGAHVDDVATLLSAFDRLLAEDNTVVVIEHNMDVIKCADHIIDLGPEGGGDGGFVVAAGTPEKVAQCDASHTGAILRGYLDGGWPELGGSTSVATDEPSRNGQSIHVARAKEHNLRNLTVSIPRDKLVVVTGVSGSGKSTLAFDIVFAEGQRRYLECLSSYIRQYLKIMDRPHVDLISGIPPTVAIEQRTSQGGKRSTVATMTEIYHYLRLLYSKLGTQHCPQCGGAITAQSPEGITHQILQDYAGKHITLLAPVIAGRKGFHKDALQAARRAGYHEARIDGVIVTLDPLPALSRYREHDIDIVVDQLITSVPDRDLLLEAVISGLRLGKGTIQVMSPDAPPRTFSRRLYCARCRIGFEELDPRLFSFNSRHGACPHCQGLGSLTDFSEDLVLPDRTKTMNEGALAPFERGPLRRQKAKVLTDLHTSLGLSLDIPVSVLSSADMAAVLEGYNGYTGIMPLLRELLKYAEGNGLLDHLLPFLTERQCPRCLGRRLNEKALAVRLKEWGIWDLVSLSVKDAERALQRLTFDESETLVAAGIIKELLAKLEFLNKVGLSYLTLDRSGDTLSGGESQRIRLAAQLGSNLTGVCYILDEPTIGLHPRDNQMLLTTLQAMRDRGNSILVVEHDEETIRRGDYIIDLGPGGGGNGGQVMAAGSLEQITRSPQSVTGAYLNGRIPPEITSRNRSPKTNQWLKVLGARAHNLKTIDVGIPLGTFTCVTGVSGSGKSTLLKTTVLNGLKRLFGQHAGPPGLHDTIDGWHYLHRVLEVDHAPIGRTPRSTPATYVGVFDDIRRLFAMTPEARTRGYGPGRFSFNVRGGRCEECGGQGTIRVQMQFLPDVYVECERCSGRRYNEDTLTVNYKGRNIHEVLETTFEEGLRFFSSIPKIRRMVQMIVDLGLGYLTFGQPSPTLSGGEAQRIKLVAELGKSSNQSTLYVLDEPTTGLHPADIAKLLQVFQQLVDHGHTVVVIEHNLAVIKEADYIIDLGPEGGIEGGYIVAQGTPAELLSHTDRSHTARFLKEYLTG